MLILSFLILVLPIAVFALPAQKRSAAHVVTRCTVPGTVALTFDDGPYNYWDEVSQALLNAGAKGTFFFNGRNWDCIYNKDASARVKRAYDVGHQIASHTWSHARLNSISGNRTELESEFKRINEALQKITGAIPAFMRPPFGEYNEKVLEVAGEYGQTVTLWDFDSGDSAGVNAAGSKKMYDDIVTKHPITLLALNHEVYKTTAVDVIPHAINVLTKAGYNLVTLADCLGQKPYQHIGSPTQRDNSWTC